MDATLQKYIDKLNALNFKEMYEGDFFLTWDKSDDELEAVFTVADALRYMRENNISTKIFESGLGISLFRDNSTRTRFSFASACNLLGLEVQDLDEGKSQIAHGETVRETANMISFMADVIGIRDDMYIGKGHTYQKEVAEAVTQGHKDGVLEQKPTLVNLQCDIDHPTQCMADMLHIINHFGGVEKLKGKKIAMSWAYSPSYGKPLSVPQGVIGLMTRFGMDVVLALEAIQDPVSLFEPVCSDGSDALCIVDQVKDERVRDEDWVQDIAISDAMGHLNEREKKILRMRFFEGRTQMEVAGEIGISQAQVSRLEKHALMNMRKHLGE